MMKQTPSSKIAAKTPLQRANSYASLYFDNAPRHAVLTLDSVSDAPAIATLDHLLLDTHDSVHIEHGLQQLEIPAQSIDIVLLLSGHVFNERPHLRHELAHFMHPTGFLYTEHTQPLELPGLHREGRVALQYGGAGVYYGRNQDLPQAPQHLFP